MIDLQAVTKTYGEGDVRVDAIRSMDLRVEDGQFLCIMGPSGSGKSTLLNLVAALEQPTSGRIVIDGRNVSTLGDDALTVFRRRNLGFVFQYFNLLPTLDALDNVLLPLMLERKVTRRDRHRAEQLLGEVGLSHRTRHRIATLSGGEAQRVAIARALIHEPALLLADEPTGNLDSATGGAILELMRAASSMRGTTVVMVTHDASAARFADRIVSIVDGRIAESRDGRGSPGRVS